MQYGNQTVTQYFYEAKTFRLSNLITVTPNQDTLQDLHYAYDAAGNVMEVKDKAQATFYYKNQAIGRTRAARYKMNE